LSTLASEALDDARDLEIATVGSRTDWDALFACAPRPHLTQTWMYGEGKRDRWEIERLVFASPRGAVAVAQVLVKRVLGLPLVARINRGPVFLETDPPAQTRAAVLRALRRRWRFLRRGALLIAPALPEGADSENSLRAAGFRKRGEFAWRSSLVDLAGSPEDMFSRLDSEWRRRVRKAEKNGVGIEASADPAAFEWMLERHAENMRAKNFVGPSTDFVRRMVAAAPGEFRLLRAVIDGEPHAAALLARFGRHAEYYLGWFDDVARRAAAGNLLLWNAALDLKRAGCAALDTGGFSVSDRYGEFKRGMRGQEYRLSGEWLAF
jgi:lipid II:glycine glycyltransferase (peptidoglycan interpeptide bridge formation enzyme)